jgi:uncharacterized cupin superfamily protein
MLAKPVVYFRMFARRRKSITGGEAMRNLVTLTIMLAAAAVALSAHHESEIVPAKIGKSEVAGAIFEHEDMIETKHDSGNVTLDVTTLLSSDKKFASGMYRSGKSYFEATDPYGVDEFMYFLEGSVKLTSSDGTVQTINAGEAVTIPKEWTGIWDTDGYTKMWVIYSADGSGL